MSYAELVNGQHLDLEIPVRGSLPAIDPNDPIGIAGFSGLNVAGDPPLKPIAQYRVVGESFERPGIRDIVMGNAQYGGDITVLGMLHARLVRPATLGSTLVSAGSLDREKFPSADVVVRGNLVAVVSPDEWEAAQGARAVAASTRWTSWEELPPSETVIKALHSADWTSVGTRGDAAETDAAFGSAEQVLSTTYEQPYVRHAPIGAFVAVADAKADGSITIWSQSSQSQGARANIANTMGVPVDKVTIRWAQGPGQYGRTTYGGDSAMADAAILSKSVGKPVRVQWTLADDLAWSSVSPAWYANVQAGLDGSGNMVAVKSDWYSPHENDARMLGAILAGLPTLTTGVSYTYGAIHNAWPYDKVPAFEQAFSTENVGNDSAGGGLRGNIMRTPLQRQQNTALEGLVTEAAAAAGADPIEFRIRHTTNEALIGILRDTADAAGWQSRPSPNAVARRTGAAPVNGRGVGVIIRSGAPWVAIVDVGKVMNPRHLKSMLQGGAVMGIGEALFEEVTFDASKVTSTDWNRYRIPRMGDAPEIKAVFASRDDRGINGGGEAANAVTPTAIMAAFFDATGVMPRHIPLTSAYVRDLLRG